MRINSRGTHVASTSAYEGGCTWQRAAVGEAFGDLAGWEASMFETPFLSGGSRALAVLRLPDDLPTLDLDDPRVDHFVIKIIPFSCSFTNSGKD